MLSLHKIPPDGPWQRMALVWLAGQTLSCLPSDFDKLTDETRDPATCLASECPDGSIDAGQDDDGDTDPASEERDPAAEDAEVDAAAEDATMELADAAASHGDDASTQADTGLLPSQACDGNPPLCQANELGRQMEMCGNCGRGTRTRTRSCAEDGCSWRAWSAWSACANQNTECDPNAPAQTQTVSCTTCGTRTQSRSCARDTCTWGPWADASTCTWCEECSEVVYCDTPADIADRGTWCRQKACSRQQALSDCMEDVQSACGATTQPFYMQYL